MKIPIPIPILCLLSLIGCTSSNVVEGNAAAAKHEMIKSGSFHEECLTLHTNQTLEYSFETEKPVRFNIHYHEGTEVIYPISKDNISVLNGTFNPKTTQHYCLMWSNQLSDPVPLTYRLQLKADE